MKSIFWTLLCAAAWSALYFIAYKAYTPTWSLIAAIVLFIVSGVAALTNKMALGMSPVRYAVVVVAAILALATISFGVSNSMLIH